MLRVEELLEERTKKLQESEAKFRLLFDSIPETVLVHDDQGHIRMSMTLGPGGLTGRLLTHWQALERHCCATVSCTGQ